MLQSKKVKKKHLEINSSRFNVVFILNTTVNFTPNDCISLQVANPNLTSEVMAASEIRKLHNIAIYIRLQIARFLYNIFENALISEDIKLL